ncbi:MAG: hypothetical protein RL605_744 [Actinomycetota bacterium]|jgi:cytoskeletal protein RodZ
MSSTEDLLATRYRKSKKTTSKSQRVWIWVTAGTLIVAFLGWAAYTSLANYLEPKAELLGFTVVDQWHATARVKIGISGNDNPTCALQAQSQSFAIVGYREVKFDYVPDQVKDVSINTTEKAVSVSVLRCW